MAKKLIEGKKKSKGKKYSHRPVRAENVYFDEVDRKWYKKVRSWHGHNYHGI